MKRKVGRGGNADVWDAIDAKGRRVAIKVLRAASAKSESYRRFQREITEHAKLSDEGFAGVLPLINHHLPDAPTENDPAWLATPLAERLDNALGKSPALEAVVDAVAGIADTLARLHARGLAHRDIKPSNCYRYEGRWMLGDFGLIQTPLDGEAALTVGAMALGPRAFIAPEMVLNADKAEGASADVYSLGKTLWALAAGLPIPPIGEHRTENVGKRLADFGVSHPRAFLLDRLIDLMTREPPIERPSMLHVAQELRAWAAKPTPREGADLDLADVAAAIAHVLQADSRVAAQRQSRFQQAESIARDIARGIPEILERLSAAGVQHSGLSTDHAGISGALADEFNKTPNIDVAGWRSCSLQRNTGVGAYAFLRFGAGAALSRDGLVAMGAVYVLNDTSGNRILWIDTDTALVGSASYEEKAGRLAEGLVTNLSDALNEFHKSIATP